FNEWTTSSRNRNLQYWLGRSRKKWTPSRSPTSILRRSGWRTSTRFQRYFVHAQNIQPSESRVAFKRPLPNSELKRTEHRPSASTLSLALLSAPKGQKVSEGGLLRDHVSGELVDPE